MAFEKVHAGRNVPDDCNVIIEIPMRSDPIKYEVDKESGTLFVDRFMSTSMHYPCNYGYMPKTLCDDGDPLDFLVLSPMPVAIGAVVRCRPLGVLRMSDENGLDAKILGVPVAEVCRLYDAVRTVHDLPAATLDQIAHFFEHYKDLEPGKFVELKGWAGAEEAHMEILRCLEKYSEAA